MQQTYSKGNLAKQFQNSPYVMEKEFDPEITEEAKNRLSFLERYEGFCIDLIKELSTEVR